MRQSIASLFSKRVEENPDKIFLYFEDNTYSYRDAGEAVSRLATGLLRIGVGKGDKVCTFLFNSVEHLWVWFALAKIGAIWVPLNTSLKLDDLTYTINDAEARVLILQENLLERYLEAKQGLTNLEQVVCLGGNGRVPQGILDYISLTEAEGNPANVPVLFHDVMSIVYTGGTTGPPKGVVLPHFSYICAGLRIIRRLGIMPDDCFLRLTPLNHVAAQHYVIAALLGTIPVALIPRFSASQFWDQVRKYRTTIINLIGPMFEILLKQAQRDNDRDHFVRLMTGIELSNVPREKLSEFKERFGIEMIQETYGMTEFGCLMTVNPCERLKEGSIGTPSEDIEMDIFDEDDFPLPPGEEGELVVRPKLPFNGMLGYYKKPDDTIEAFRNLWFHTGDMGYKDRENYFSLVGRKSHKIRRKGENISAYEVEETIKKYPKIEEAVAVGIPPDLGDDEEVTVFIKPEAGCRIDPAEIVLWCSERLAPFKVPRYVAFVNEFPRTEATQRIERKKLRARGVGNAWDSKAPSFP